MSGKLSVRDITGRASVRAIPPKKWARFMTDATTRDQLEGEAAEQAIADGLLHQLMRPGSPALLISYLTHALSVGLFTGRTFAIALLAYLYRCDNPSSVPMSLLAPISTALMSFPTGLDSAQGFLPSPVQLPSDTPDIGTSASATTDETPVLSLLMPLLRLCAAGPVPAPVMTLAARLTSLIPPLPVPPFEVGLEGAQLSAVLPEDIGKSLRECLAGLMGDLPMPAAQPVAGALFGGGMQDVATATAFGDLGSAAMSTLAPLQGPASVPLRHATAFLLEYTHRAHSWIRNSGYARNPPLPPSHYQRVIRLGRSLTGDPQEFLVALLDVAVSRVITSWSQGPAVAVRPYTFFTDELPVLLRWWRDNADSKWPFPLNLRGALADVFAAHSGPLQNCSQALNSIYTAKFSQSENDDEAGPYMQPDGWSLLSVETTAVRRLVALGLLDDEGTAALTGSPVKPSPAGESLLERLASSAPSHLPALEFFITFTAGAPQAFGAEVVKSIENSLQQPPPENLFIRLAASSSLLALLAAYIPPLNLLELLTIHWLDRIEDESARAEDPQASLIRFGSSVVLAEALCAQFDLPLPSILYDSRRALNIGDLSETELASVNGWIKALFGSDGIDDEIVMSTSAQGLTRFASTLVQQAVVAAMSGQIDFDTLHSGLSYYAQPLLSWCLGSVVAWLCAEIERQGALSGMHLKVLQTLILDSAFPDSLLRANAKAIAHLLEPAAGLQPVMMSSSFDHVGVRNRLQAVGGPDGGPLIPDMIPPPAIPFLRGELQSIRHLHLAAPGWERRILDALVNALRIHGPLKTLEAVLIETLYPSLMEMENGTQGDPLGPFIALLSALEFNISPSPFAFVIIDGYLPTLFGLRSPFIPTPPIIQPHQLMAMPPPPAPPPPPPLPFAVQALHRLLRTTLLATDTAVDTLADTLATHLADELAYQRSRPDSSAKRPKRSAKGLGPGAAPDHGLTPEQRAVVVELSKALEADEELRTRWPALAPAPATAPAAAS